MTCAAGSLGLAARSLQAGLGIAQCWTTLRCDSAHESPVCQIQEGAVADQRHDQQTTQAPLRGHASLTQAAGVTQTGGPGAGAQTIKIFCPLLKSRKAKKHTPVWLPHPEGHAWERRRHTQATRPLSVDLSADMLSCCSRACPPPQPLCPRSAARHGTAHLGQQLAKLVQLLLEGGVVLLAPRHPGSAPGSCRSGWPCRCRSRCPGRSRWRWTFPRTACTPGPVSPHRRSGLRGFRAQGVGFWV